MGEQLFAWVHAWVWSGVLWIGGGSSIIGGVWMDIFCVKLFRGWCSLFLLCDCCSSSISWPSKLDDYLEGGVHYFFYLIGVVAVSRGQANLMTI